MERDTRAIFEELTRGVEEEISSRQFRERTARRRKAPYLFVHASLGVVVTTVVGVRQPLLGALMFLGLTWSLHRSAARILPDNGR